MERRAVKVHKMFREFHEEKDHGYIGEYDEKHNLIAIYDIFKEKNEENRRNLSMDFTFIG